jgi:hypothetical protein
MYSVTKYPIFILARSFLPSFELLTFSLLLLGYDHHFNGVINHQGQLQHFPSDGLPALWTFLSPNKALSNTLMTE